MKAIIYRKYGSPDVIELAEVDKPIPRDGEVLIRIHAASVSAADGMMRTGTPYFGRLFTGLRKPKNPIPGTGFAGVIESVGKDVKSYKEGDQVFGEATMSFGAHAEYVCVEEDGLLTTKPADMSFEEAASICDGPLTSLNFLRELTTVKSGQKVLINGASGSLGTAAVQLAKHFGARVTGVCSTANTALVKNLGADHVIDYTHQDFTAGGEIYDVIYDTVGKSTFSKCKGVLSDKGVYLSPVFGPALLLRMLWTSIVGRKQAKFSATGARPVPVLRALLQDLKELFEAGKLRAIIDERYPLEKTADAHRYVDAGHKKGNVVLTLVGQS